MNGINNNVELAEDFGSGGYLVSGFILHHGTFTKAKVYVSWPDKDPS